MSTIEQHTLVLAAENPDGSQEWICPTCGRRMLIKWPPEYYRTILEEGNPFAIHTGDTGVYHIHHEVFETREMHEPEDPYLEPFKAWMERREG